MSDKKLEHLTLQQKFGQCLMIGFHGSELNDSGVQQIIADAEAGRIGGVILFGYNVVDPEQTRTLITALKNCQSPLPLFIAVDQEGGKVQRLNAAKGFIDTDSAFAVAQNKSTAEANAHYKRLSVHLASFGINLNFAPCVDLHADDSGRTCEVIGALERSFASDTETIEQYAKEFIAASHEHGVISCLKHFPGHGFACGDTHCGLQDITASWSEKELLPYKHLIAASTIPMIMSAHLLHREIDSALPATLSKEWHAKLRGELNFDGVLVSDCLHMGAIIQSMSLSSLLLSGLEASLDIFLFSNNPLAAKSLGIRQHSDSKEDYVQQDSWIIPDSHLPSKCWNIVSEAVADGRIAESRIEESFQRVLAVKRATIMATCES